MSNLSFVVFFSSEQQAMGVCHMLVLLVDSSDSYIATPSFSYSTWPTPPTSLATASTTSLHSNTMTESSEKSLVRQDSATTSMFSSDRNSLKDANAPTTAPAEEQKLTMIAPDGDVLLVLADGTEARVSSASLTTTCPVFGAMLGPNFREGQGERSFSHPARVTLPDDEPNLMILLCHLLHETPGCLHQLTATLSNEALCLEFAELADKYLVKEYLTRRATEIFDVSNNMIANDGEKVRNLTSLAAAAYVLKEEGFFMLFTRRIILSSTTRIPTGSLKQENELLPRNIFGRFSLWRCSLLRATRPGYVY